jgi:hypothetical protein
MDNVLAKNENANTARRKRAVSGTRDSPNPATEGPVNSDYGTCLE